MLAYYLLIATTRTGDLAALARRVEALGFESLWIPEHPVIPVGFTTAFPLRGRHGSCSFPNTWAQRWPMGTHPSGLSVSRPLSIALRVSR